jgi:hypothetical protein
VNFPFWLFDETHFHLLVKPSFFSYSFVVDCPFHMKRNISPEIEMAFALIVFYFFTVIIVKILAIYTKK